MQTCLPALLRRSFAKAQQADNAKESKDAKKYLCVVRFLLRACFEIFVLCDH